MNYSCYGLVLGSAMELPELPPAPPGGVPDLRIESPATCDGIEGATVLDEVDEWGEVWANVSQARGRTIVGFPGLATFDIDLDGPTIGCSPSPGADLAWVRHRMINLVVPRALAMLGHVVLHAGAVLLDGGGVALCGPSGSGKSTAAARLGRAGLPVLADDSVRVVPGRPPSVVASYPGFRFWSDVLHLVGEPRTVPLAEATTKRRVDVLPGVRFVGGPAPLALLVDLRPDLEDPGGRMRGAAAFETCLRSTFPPYGEDLGGWLPKVMALASAVPTVAVDPTVDIEVLLATLRGALAA